MFANNSWATIWSFEDKVGYGNANVSTSKKDQESGQYETDFQHKFVGVSGEAYEFLKSCSIPDKKGIRVRLVRVGLTNKYDPDKKVTYWNPKIYEIDEGDGNSPAPAPKGGNKKVAAPAKKTTSKTDYAVLDDNEDSPLPF